METWDIQSGPQLPFTATNAQAVSYNGTVYVIANDGKVAELNMQDNSWREVSKIVGLGLRQVYPAPVIGKHIFN